MSVVIAVKDVSRFIEATLESIQNQTFTDFEVIIVDDGSTDGTPCIVSRIASKDPRFVLVSNGGVPGQSGALNYGIDRAQGDWVARCDGDDVWTTNKLECQMSYMRAWSESEPIVVLGTAGYTINEKGKELGTLDAGFTTIDAYRAMRAVGSAFMLHHSSVVFDRGTFLRVGGYRTDYIGAEDTDLFTRMSEFGAVLNMPKRLIYYRKHGQSFSLSKTRTQAVNLQRISCNVHRRKEGLPELSYEEFEAQILAWPERDRTTFERDVQTKLLYRQGAILAANGRLFKGILHLIRVFFRNPRIVANAFSRLFAR